METQIKALGLATKNDIVDPDLLAEYIGRKLRGWRIFREVTQVDLAKMTGLTRQTVSNIEAGRSVGIQSVYLIGRALGVSMEQIFPAYEVLEELK